MSTIREVNARGEITPEAATTEIVSKGVLTPTPEDPLLRTVERVLGVDGSNSGQYAVKIQDILDWAKGITEDHSPENIAWVIRDLEMKIGSPSLSEKMVDYMHSYVGLMDKKVDIDKKLKRYNPYASE